MYIQHTGTYMLYVLCIKYKTSYYLIYFKVILRRLVSNSKCEKSHKNNVNICGCMTKGYSYSYKFYLLSLFNTYIMYCSAVIF